MSTPDIVHDCSFATSAPPTLRFVSTSSYLFFAFTRSLHHFLHIPLPLLHALGLYRSAYWYFCGLLFFALLFSDFSLSFHISFCAVHEQFPGALFKNVLHAALVQAAGKDGSVCAANVEGLFPGLSKLSQRRPELVGEDGSLPISDLDMAVDALHGATLCACKWHVDLNDLPASLKKLFPSAQGICFNLVRPATFAVAVTVDGSNHKVEIHVALLPGLSLFLRFFYGIRCVMEHGDFSETLRRGCLRQFVVVDGCVKGSEALQALLRREKPHKEHLEKLHNSVAAQLNAASNGITLSCRSLPKPDDLLAKWMVKQIVLFVKHAPLVNISTLHARTTIDFLQDAADVYTASVLAFVQEATPRIKFAAKKLGDGDGIGGTED